MKEFMQYNTVNEYIANQVVLDRYAASKIHDFVNVRSEIVSNPMDVYNYFLNIGLDEKYTALCTRYICLNNLIA